MAEIQYAMQKKVFFSPYSFLELCRDKFLVFSPKYRGKVLEGEVVEAAEEIIRENCKELDIEVIDLAVSVDHVHLFIKYPFRKSVYGKMLRSEGSISTCLRSGARDTCGRLLVIMDPWGMGGKRWRSMYRDRRRGKRGKENAMVMKKRVLCRWL